MFKGGQASHLKCSVWFSKLVRLLNKQGVFLASWCGFRWGRNCPSMIIFLRWRCSGVHETLTWSLIMSWMRLYSRTHLQFVSAPQLCRPFGSSVSAQCLQRSQQFVLSGSVRHHVAVLLQQDAVQRVLVVNVTTHHHYILFPVLQVGAVAQIRGPQELPVLQAEAVPVGVDDLDVITRLLASVQLPEDSSPENWQQTDKSMNC